MAVRTILIAGVLAISAAAAYAEPARPDSAAALKAAVFAQAAATKGQGMARTSIDHRFEGKAATGSLGFLCARPDSLDERASASPLGSDPHGRFVGARLAFAFR
ncbi:MAG: hypothetical protein ACJ798_14825 [Phenylobacterium sp.]|jgi:hypothetical protein